MSQENKRYEMNTIFQIAKKNEYPLMIIKQLNEKIMNKKQNTTQERDAPFQSLLLHMSLPEQPQSPFCPRAVCKPDKPLDIRRSLWSAPIKGNAPEPLINSFIISL
jgi:hypothetical protein